MLGKKLKEKDIKIEIVTADVIVTKNLIPEFKIKDVSRSDDSYCFYKLTQKDKIETFLSKKALIEYLKEIVYD